MKITQQYFGLGNEKPKEISIEQARSLFKSANSVKRIFRKAFVLSHGVKGRVQVRSVLQVN